jgi:regulator of sirC expression with transglutaminase-like and TPR domain
VSRRRDPNFSEFVRGPRLDWLTGALIIAADVYPGLDFDQQRAKLAQLATPDPGKVVDLPPHRQAEVVADLVFRRAGFHGNEEHYDDPRNSFINQVLDRRTGVPITLALVYTEVARLLGIQAVGVGFPGHFLVKVVDTRRTAGVDRSVFVDPFYSGAVLNEKDLSDLAERCTGDNEVDPEWLVPVSSRQALHRMLSNLRSCYQQRGETAQLLVVLHRLLEIAPHSASVLRERGNLQAKLGAPRAAISDLESYLERLPRASDAQEVQGVIDELSDSLHRAGARQLLN